MSLQDKFLYHLNSGIIIDQLYLGKIKASS